MEKILQEGILFVDKPTGVSSHRVVNWARKLSGIKKVGHTGTLDPLATGLLILLIGRKYTRLQDEYLKQDKEYECTAQLGITTDSYDIDGTVLETADWSDIVQITKDQLEKTLLKFTGEIQQAVPIYSAVKKQGKKLYEIAREAKKNEAAQKMANEILENLPKRTVQIYNLQLTDFEKNEAQKKLTFSFKVSCSSGTYIRSLAHDIGTELGVGATVVSLRRTKIGGTSIDQVEMCPLFFRRA